MSAQSKQNHRGQRYGDAELFCDEAIEPMREALADLCWLLSRGYANPSSLKLVGDRHGLRARQRMALRRSACSDEQQRRRSATREHSLQDQRVAVDGFNCLITFEVMLAGGPVFVGRDGVRRDIASVHGSYRTVEETDAAIDILTSLLRPAEFVTWLLDRPISNSGRLAQRLRENALAHALPWHVEVVDDPDRALVAMTNALVATTDSGILDRAQRWIDLGSLFEGDSLWLLDLRGPH